MQIRSDTKTLDILKLCAKQNFCWKEFLMHDNSWKATSMQLLSGWLIDTFFGGSFGVSVPILTSKWTAFLHYNQDIAVTEVCYLKTFMHFLDKFNYATNHWFKTVKKFYFKTLPRIKNFKGTFNLDAVWPGSIVWPEPFEIIKDI